MQQPLRKALEWILQPTRGICSGCQHLAQFDNRVRGQHAFVGCAVARRRCQRMLMKHTKALPDPLVRMLHVSVERGTASEQAFRNAAQWIYVMSRSIDDLLEHARELSHCGLWCCSITVAWM